MSEEQIKIPVWEKYALTIQEGAAYFGVGERCLRQIAVEHSSADFLLHVGVKYLFKRQLFEKFLNETSSLYKLHNIRFYAILDMVWQDYSFIK